MNRQNQKIREITFSGQDPLPSYEIHAGSPGHLAGGRTLSVPDERMWSVPDGRA